MLVGRLSYAYSCTQITLFMTTPYGHLTSSGADHIGGSARGYLAVGGPLSSPGMAY